MSGIFGILRRDGRPVDRRDLECMRDSMVHRGPDGSAIWAEGPAGLGQLMLHSTPESLHEELPWKDSESGLVITADARIDNREELINSCRQELASGWKAHENHGCSPSQTSVEHPPDSLLILAAFKRWGEACVDHLLGDFAFVIWDMREKRFFCARDHMGIRPFYYYLSKEAFVFASAAIGVVSIDAVPKRINETHLADYLVRELAGFDKTSTWFEGVKRLPPAQRAWVSGDNFTPGVYWQPDAKSELRLGSDEAYTDALEETLAASVRARLRSHQPVASMLSGGVDSSTIVGVARKLECGSEPPLAVYTGASEELNECPEARFSQMVIDQGGLDAHFLRPSDVSRFNERLRRVDDVLEDPFDALWIMHKMIYLSAVDNGSVAVMDGIDGDGVASLTTTYPAYLFRAGHWRSLHREMRSLQHQLSGGEEPLWKYYAQALKPVLANRFTRKLKRVVSGPKNAVMNEDCLVNSLLAARVNLPERFRQYRMNSDFSNHRTLREAHVARVTVPYLTGGIERYGRLAAICGAEQRQPLLDKRFVELCIALPWQYKVRGGRSKYALRRVAERLVPAGVAWRSGRNHVMWKFWTEWGRLNRDENGVFLCGKLAPLENYIEQNKFIECRKRYMIAEDESNETVLAVLCLQRWLERNQLK